MTILLKSSKMHLLRMSKTRRWWSSNHRNRKSDLKPKKNLRKMHQIHNNKMIIIFSVFNKINRLMKKRRKPPLNKTIQTNNRRNKMTKCPTNNHLLLSNKSNRLIQSQKRTKKWFKSKRIKRKMKTTNSLKKQSKSLENKKRKVKMNWK